MDIIGKRARVIMASSGEVRGKGFITHLPEESQAKNYGDKYAVVYTMRREGNPSKFCSFTNIGTEENGIIVELEED